MTGPDSDPNADADSVLLGIDAGLTNVTVTAFDPDGIELESASEPTPTIDSPPEHDEQDHDRLWSVVCETVRRTLDSEAVDPDSVAGVGVSGHGHGLYGIDGDGAPVCAIKSTDSRALSYLADHRSAALDTVVQRLGWTPFGADPLSLLVWLSEQAPETYARLDTILFSKDVLTYRLTGDRSTDPSEASVFYGPTGDYDRRVFAALGIEDAFSALPPVVSSTEACGTVTREAASRTGLPAGTPVATGLQDVGACTLGAGVLDSGDGLVILGTWGQSVAVLDSPEAGTGGLPRRYLDGWLRYRGLRAGAACVEWFVENCGAHWQADARERGIDPYVVYEEAVSSVDPGAEGLLFHPFLDGSTDDPTSAGGFYGLRLTHSSADMLRAIYEGVSVSLTSALEELAADRGLDSIRVTGGGAQSEQWTRMFADMAGTPATTPGHRETGALGAALCGGTAAGVYPDIETAVGRAVGIGRSYDPDPTVAEVYRTTEQAFDEAIAGMQVPWETLKSARGKPYVEDKK